MTDRSELPYGSWPSPISIDMAVSSALSLREPRLTASGVYWTEGRPQERGRQVIVRWDVAGGTIRDVTPPPFNARTMAHEYGGGWYDVGPDEVVYFSNLEDGRIYRQAPDASPVALTAEGQFRYGDLVYDRAHSRLLCVREDLSGLGEGAVAPPGGRLPEPSDALIAIDPVTGEQTVLAQGYDFYSTPRPSPDGRMLAWLCWRHPNMPWDGTELWVAEKDPDGLPSSARLIAGGSDESVVQPEWAPDGSLVYVSDQSGWWNLYRWTEASGQAIPVAATDAEFAGPQWIFGMRWFGIASDGTIVATVRRSGRDPLWLIPAGGAPRELDVPDERIEPSVHVAGRRVCYVGSGPSQATSIALVDLDSGERKVLRTAFELEVDPGYVSAAEAIEFPTSDGDTAYAFYYPPTNAAHVGAPSERPPLVVMSHGGPTASASASLDMGKQVFTSRGFGVVDVNYRGSSGYGREYMRKLDGKWGIYDLDDCIAAARYLAERGDVDEKRLAIRGGSAGGYTTLCALVFSDVFSAGASYYGVGDLEALARDTHKFESRYLDRMVAPYPDGLEVYRKRSPIYFVDRIRSPLIVFQGEDDMVVPIAQAEQLVASLRERRVPHAYIAFAGEGHGFRQATNMRRALEAELSFYAQIFGFQLADEFEPVEVEFLAQR